jgi:SAM-dependent methyltransferase
LAVLELKTIQVGLYDLQSIAKEIIDFTGEDDVSVWRRIALEIENPGYNVRLSAERYGVLPHEFNDNMISLYRESDGFIYETLVESRNPYRVEKWINILEFILSSSGPNREANKILLYGDSVGSDSIFLKSLGFDVYYYDFDSYCAKFADYRFGKRSLDIKKFSTGEMKFDFVICLEVAEHVPNPEELVDELSSLTKKDGFCIFSEAFHLINANFPTHLNANLRYVGKVDQLFESAGMIVAWRDVHDKPIVYTKSKDNVRLNKDGIIKKITRKIIAVVHRI